MAVGARCQVHATMHVHRLIVLAARIRPKPAVTAAAVWHGRLGAWAASGAGRSGCDGRSDHSSGICSVNCTPKLGFVGFGGFARMNTCWWVGPMEVGQLSDGALVLSELQPVC